MLAVRCWANALPEVDQHVCRIFREVLREASAHQVVHASQLYLTKLWHGVNVMQLTKLLKPLWCTAISSMKVGFFLGRVTCDSFSATFALLFLGLQARINCCILGLFIFWTTVQVKPCSTYGDSLCGKEQREVRWKWRSVFIISFHICIVRNTFSLTVRCRKLFRLDLQKTWKTERRRQDYLTINVKYFNKGCES